MNSKILWHILAINKVSDCPDSSSTPIERQTKTKRSVGPVEEPPMLNMLDGEEIKDVGRSKKYGRKMNNEYFDSLGVVPIYVCDPTPAYIRRPFVNHVALQVELP
jgi:hypothetical protein